MQTRFLHILITSLVSLLLIDAADAQSTATYNALKVEASASSGNHTELRGDGIIFEKGSATATLLSTDLGQPGFLWHPSRQALVLGYLPSSEASIGYGSVSFPGSRASGGNATAMGYGNASGSLSLAGGTYTNAGGSYSFAFGIANNALGLASIAFGGGTTAGGSYSTALGTATLAGSYDSLAIGRYNLGNYTAATNGNAASGGDQNWISTDPIFEIGNGISSLRSNALTVYKNGNADINGNLKVTGVIRTTVPAGDIPMFTVTP